MKLVALAGVLVLMLVAGHELHDSGRDDPRVELYMLSPRYQGPVLVIYDQPTGVGTLWHRDTAIYAVPSTGVVRVKASQPGRATAVTHVYGDAPNKALPYIGTCKASYQRLTDDRPIVCDTGFDASGTGIPDHIVAIISDRKRLPENFDRTIFVFDSVVWGGKGMFHQRWSDPP